MADHNDRLLAIEEAEAACCPEDVGFPEYIRALRGALDEAERLSNAVYDTLAPLVPESERDGNILHLAQRVARRVPALEQELREANAYAAEAERGKRESEQHAVAALREMAEARAERDEARRKAPT